MSHIKRPIVTDLSCRRPIRVGRDLRDIETTVDDATWHFSVFYIENGTDSSETKRMCVAQAFAFVLRPSAWGLVTPEPRNVQLKIRLACVRQGLVEHYLTALPLGQRTPIGGRHRNFAISRKRLDRSGSNSVKRTMGLRGARLPNFTRIGWHGAEQQGFEIQGQVRERRASPSENLTSHTAGKMNAF